MNNDDANDFNSSDDVNDGYNYNNARTSSSPSTNNKKRKTKKKKCRYFGRLNFEPD